jgi:hypothetical protein
LHPNIRRGQWRDRPFLIEVDLGRPFLVQEHWQRTNGSGTIPPQRRLRARAVPSMNCGGMQVQVRAAPIELNQSIRDRVVADVTESLQSVRTDDERFVVNDTLWYGLNRQGRATLQVVNSAGFISQRFENYLHDVKGWQNQKMIDRQRIDGYIELPCPAGVVLDKAKIAGFLDRFMSEKPEASVDDVLFRYMHRRCFNLNIEEYSEFFAESSGEVTLRIGLEFETGNIASSFRALNKLNFLFRKGQIDAGVFITSIDKRTTSARIWPSSNRNGSFQELERRNYRDTITFPIWELSFAPDAVDANAPYLGSGGETYIPVNTGATIEIRNTTYEKWTGDGKELLRKVTPARQ